LFYIWQSMAITEILQQWWHQQTWLEIIGVITGLACVLLAAMNNIWNWPLAIISVSIYVIIFFEARLFADMGLQFYFLAMNIYGWYYWSHKPANEAKTPVTRISRQEVLLAIAGVAIFTVVLGSGLKYTSASYPYLDSFLYRMQPDSTGITGPQSIRELADMGFCRCNLCGHLHI
jgi:nicotinamide mononucleotide transporter